MVHKLLNAGADVNIAENVKKSCYNFFYPPFSINCFPNRMGVRRFIAQRTGDT